MNKKAALATPAIVFGFVVFTIMIVAITTAISDVTENYGISSNDTELEDIYTDWYKSNITDLEGEYTDEAQKAKGEDIVEADVSSTFRGIKITAKTFDMVQQSVPAFQRLFNFIPGWIYTMIIFAIIIIITAAIYSDLRGK